MHSALFGLLTPSVRSITMVGEGRDPETGYEVFLSFRGRDVRRGFLSHLYEALTSAGFTVFLDSREITRGDDISASLHHAIQTNGKDKQPAIAIPLFYDVTPSQVRHPDSSPFAEAFEEHEGRGRYSQPEIDEWKAALRTISHLRGWSLQEDANGYEAALVKRVVEDVGKLRRTARL